MRAAQLVQCKLSFKDGSTLPPSVLVGKDPTTGSGDASVVEKTKVSTELIRNT